MSTRSQSSGVRFLTRTLTAFGYCREQLRRGPAPSWLLTWGIMHRYSNLTWWMRRLPERRRAVAIYGPTSSGKTALSLADALGHIWAYSRRQRSWFRKLGASRVDHRSAVKTIMSRLQ